MSFQIRCVHMPSINAKMKVSYKCNDVSHITYKQHKQKKPAPKQ